MNEHNCFVISPIGDDGSEVRKRSDQVLKHVIRPIVENKKGYQVVRADEISIPGNITAQILDHIATADLVIADLTGHNPNVFYELALRHALNLPVIQIIANGEHIPFDVGQIRTIKFNYQDLDDVERCKIELSKQIENIEKNPKVTGSPIASVLSAIKIRNEDDPLPKVNAEIMQRLGELTEQFGGLNSKLMSSSSPAEEPFAEFLEGQEKAFEALTIATKTARDTIRSSRYGPESVLGLTEYVAAIEQRVNGSDGQPPLKHYYRVIAVNNLDKQRDVYHHLTSFIGRPFILKLTSQQNFFELVIIDTTDVFIHFYKEEKVVASSLHLRGSQIANEFIEIFDRLADRETLEVFDCAKIDLNSFPSDRVKEIFRQQVEEVKSSTAEARKIVRQRQAPTERV